MLYYTYHKLFLVILSNEHVQVEHEQRGSNRILKGVTMIQSAGNNCSRTF